MINKPTLIVWTLAFLLSAGCALAGTLSFLDARANPPEKTAPAKS